ncbi:G-type lectin S-receptor-like serine/threonine-protein kinase LECRK3 [Linum perenne]
MPNVNFPDGDYESFETYTEEVCREACLSDCRCAVAFFGGICWKKRLPVSNGKVEISTSGKALIKVRRSNSTSSCQYPDPNYEKDRSASTTFLLISRQRDRKNHKKSRVQLQQNQESLYMNLRNFSYSELELATNGFKEVLGSGASGTVYKGVLVDQQLVAVKRLDKMVNETQANHKNLVKLVGFCNEGQHRILVYEFMSNGSLANLLFGDHSRPSWYTRVEIAYAVARGLVYLHDECSNQIIHCDIKPQNVLLDESLTAKISDFGLAKLLMANQTRGTKGYVAPEWFRNSPVTVKVDVYSFGVLLLEIISCRRSVDANESSMDRAILTYWAYDRYSEGAIGDIVEYDMEAMSDGEKLEKYVKIAIWCIQEDPSVRPTMKQVWQMLEGLTEVPVPPCPTPYTMTITKD